MTAAATDLATRPVTDVTAAEEWSVERIVLQTQKIQQCMNAVMVDGEHYGVIPGTQGRDGKPPKKTLLKPGAEKLCLMFRLCPEYEIIQSEHSPGFISYTVRCTLTHIPTGARVATGLGSCNSRENKYVRPAPKTCPKCGGAFLIAGNPEYERDAAFKGGMLCYGKKGGCGAKFKPGDESIEKQPTGIADPADLDNTLLKMGCKRSLVAASLNATAASDCFTQDLEDLTEKAAEYTPPAAREPAPGPPAPPPPNMPAPRRDGPGAWPKAVHERASAAGDRALDDQFRRTVGAPVASDLEVQLQRSVDENTIEVIDRQTGEVTKHNKMTKAQGKKIHAMVRDLNISDEAYRQGLKKYYAVDSSDLLTKAQAADMIERLAKTAERARGVNDKYDAVADEAAKPPEDMGDVPTPEEMDQRQPGEDS